MGIDHCLFDPSNILPWHMDHDLALHISHIWFIKRVDEATEIAIFHKYPLVNVYIAMENHYFIAG